MKIAFAIYPEIDLLDLFLLVDSLKQMKMPGLKPHGLEYDFCTLSELPVSVNSALQADLIKPIVTPSLKMYDVVVVAGSQPRTETSTGVKRWLESITSDAIIFVTGSAVRVMKEIQNWPETHFFTAATRVETILLSVKLVKLMAGEESGEKLALTLGLPSDLISKTLIPARHASITRKTKETSIELKLSLDGTGKNNISTGIPFFDHMLTQIAVHGLFDLSIQCKGDLEVDLHHTVEDVALALGKAFDQALGDRKGLVRMASATVPMDESLAQVNLDFSGRAYTVVEAGWNDVKVGDLPVTLVTHFLESFATQARCNLAVRLLAGSDDHHRAEAIFKALARALDAATQIDPRRLNAIPSSKGVI